MNTDEQNLANELLGLMKKPRPLNMKVTLLRHERVGVIVEGELYPDSPEIADDLLKALTDADFDTDVVAFAYQFKLVNLRELAEGDRLKFQATYIVTDYMS